MITNRRNYSCVTPVTEAHYQGRWITDAEHLTKSTGKLKVADYDSPIKLANLGLKKTAFAYNDYHHMLKNKVVSMLAKEYFKSVADDYDKVSISSEVLGGMPSIKGSRIPVSLILSCLSDGMSLEEISEDYGIAITDIQQSLKFVADLLNRPFYED